MKPIKNSSEGSRTSQRKTTLSLLQVCHFGYNIGKRHLGNQLQSWANAFPTHIGIIQENGTDQPKVYSRTRTMLKIRCTNVRETRHSYSQSTESEKAKFQLQLLPMQQETVSSTILQKMYHRTLSTWLNRTLKLLLLLILNQKKGRCMLWQACGLAWGEICMDPLENVLSLQSNQNIVIECLALWMGVCSQKSFHWVDAWLFSRLVILLGYRPDSRVGEHACRILDVSYVKYLEVQVPVLGIGPVLQS